MHLIARAHVKVGRWYAMTDSGDKNGVFYPFFLPVDLLFLVRVIPCTLPKVASQRIFPLESPTHSRKSVVARDRWGKALGSLTLLHRSYRMEAPMVWFMDDVMLFHPEACNNLLPGLALGGALHVAPLWEPCIAGHFHCLAYDCSSNWG